jgi:hypothetical protein
LNLATSIFTNCEWTPSPNERNLNYF